MLILAIVVLIFFAANFLVVIANEKPWRIIALTLIVASYMATPWAAMAVYRYFAP